ncbi:MAG TPA: DNA gyrase inhibitor YacG [Steroidobacteraceae bacterium]|nr:DNA gyrase inhibitor YacG [Steroidobacteraceae bacterium]
MPARVNCPTCGRSIEWSEAAPFRPFCSERCKLVDLGAWLTEKRSIPAENSPSEGVEATDTTEDDPPGNLS